MASRLFRPFCRKKTVTEENVEKSELNRCLTVFDLTLLGVGSTLGLGVYVLAGAVARNEAGPAVTLSFLVAAIASAFAGLCYAEFAARVPKAGSAYVYSYVCVGELVAFVIGWNLILEYVIGTASVARGLSNYIDALVNNTMQETMLDLMPINIGFLSKYPDFLSFGIILLLTVLLSIGVRESTIMNNLFTIINMLVIATVIVAGSIKADVHNWQITEAELPANVTNVGTGGFMPFGMAGVMAGAAKCFYGFVGFDCVATTGEEAKNPQRSIPIAIVISLIIIFLAYFGISTVLTMMWPYYDQNADAPLPYVFMMVGWTVIKWIVTIGAVFALCTSLLGAMFPLPRILYAMSLDGLLFKSLCQVNPRTHTPLLATAVSGVLAGIMALIFDLQQLIDMMSIGTLLAYTIVSICVLVLRYEESTPSAISSSYNGVLTFGNRDLFTAVIHSLKHLFNLTMIKYPNSTTMAITRWGIVMFTILSLGFCAVIIHAGSAISDGTIWALVLISVLGFLLLLLLAIIGRQPASNMKLSFKVPMVPLIPCLSIIINLYLMLVLDSNTWIRFAVWMIVGFLIYFFYGLRHSKEGRLDAVKEKEHELKSSKEKEASETSSRNVISAKTN